MVTPFLPPRPSQWEAIRETDRHVLVVAGAGTGKTHTVIGRILYLLGVEMHGGRHPQPVRLEDIAAITFTNEAARDLKQSLRTALRATGRRQDAWQVDVARIGTIHSFCGEILRENALRTGLSPSLRVLEEGEALELATETARDTLVEALETGSVPGLEALLAGWQTRHIDRWIVDLMHRPDLTRHLDDVLNRPPPDRAGGHTADGSPEPERALVRLARNALERMARTLQREARVDFGNIIEWTRDLLQRDDCVRASLQRRIHTLIIDEFQDVDPVQRQIAYLLGGVPDSPADGTRLMLVGDPKQSIYRFRGADITVWNAVQRDFAERGCGRVMPLLENFRSLPPVLALVEATVGRILDEPCDGVEHQDFEVRFRPVEPERQCPPDEPAVEFLLVPPADNGATRPMVEARAIEADTIAQRIQELTRAGASRRDIAVLLAAWTNVRVYEDALRRRNIPFYTLRRDGFLDTREAHDLVLALEVLRDPDDARALAGFLRSPFVGVRDDTLLRMVRSGQRPYWRHLDRIDTGDAEADAGEDGESEMQRLARAGALIERFVGLRDRVPAAALLRELLEESGYLAHLQLLGEAGRQAAANVRQFLSMLAAMHDVAVGDAVRILRERRARGDRIAEAVLHGRSDEVVTITSIHVAKGLQWRTVIWADLGGGRQNFTEKLVLGRDDMRLGEADVKADDQTDPVWSQLRLRQIAAEDAERKRMWYVAATRAMDRLLLSGIPQGRTAAKDSLAFRLRELFPALLNANSGDGIEYAGTDASGVARPVHHSAHVRVGRPVDPATAAGQTAAAVVGSVTAIELPRDAVPSHVGPLRHSATAFLAHDRCPRRHWFKYVAGIREPEMEAAARDELVSAIRRGQIVHDVLERYREEDELDELLEDAIGRWDDTAPAAESERGRRYRDHLRAEVAGAVAHPAWAELANRPGARRELPFLFIHPDGAAAHGSIDLAAPAAASDDGRAAGIELLDVKTTQCDAADAPAKAAQYAPQRDVYVTAASAIAGLPVTRFAFHFTRAATQVAEPIDGQERHAASLRFAERAAAIARGMPALTSHPHECRFCGYRRVRLCPGVRFDSRDRPGPQLELL